VTPPEDVLVPPGQNPPAPFRSGAVTPGLRLRILALCAVGVISLSIGAPVPSASSDPGIDPMLAAIDPEVVRATIDAHLLLANPALPHGDRLRIVSAILDNSARYDLDPYLVAAVVVVESGARPWAYSPKGAIGLMQVMPYMMTPMRLAGNLASIESNIEAGCFILADNIRRLGEADGISAYFWGNEVRGVAYLERVQEARRRVASARPS